MSNTYTCAEDGVMPEEYQEAGGQGLVQVHSAIGWLAIAAEEWTGGACTCTYKIKQGDK